MKSEMVKRSRLESVLWYAATIRMKYRALREAVQIELGFEKHIRNHVACDNIKLIAQVKELQQRCANYITANGHLLDTAAANIEGQNKKYAELDAFVRRLASGIMDIKQCAEYSACAPCKACGFARAREDAETFLNTGVITK